MPLPHSMQIPPPANWQDFERLCYDLYKKVYNSEDVHMHGRSGQAQHGVDIYGELAQPNVWFGVQCKGKDTRYGNALKVSELRDEVEKAKNFTPPLSIFILATTAVNDVKIQSEARKLSEENQKSGLFKVRVESWDEIHQKICDYDEILKKHYSSIFNKIPPELEVKLDIFKTPRTSNQFYGRDAEITNLIDKLNDGFSVLVGGVGGIGKSELVLQALKKYEKSKNIIWCSLDKYDSVDTLIMALRQAFIVQGNPCNQEDIPSLFDKTNAVVVFDGLEQGNINQLEDILTQWYSSTNNTQFIITSQVTLFTLPDLVHVRLSGLSLAASKKLLEKLLGNNTITKNNGINELLQFCDGHALSIILCSALTLYYGDPSSAFKYIKEKNSQLLSLPEREHHTRTTSLDICLQIAYETISENTKMLLWGLSESPAGIISGIVVDGWLEIENSRDAYASLKRWHFIYEAQINDNITEAKVLTPIRKFVIKKVKQEKPKSYEKIIRLLARHFACHVAALEEQLENPDNTPHIMWRYSKILPNLLNIIDHSLIRENDKELNNIANFIAYSIMPYYFVLGEYDVGAKVILNVANLALKMDNLESANNLAQQVICLAQRSYEKPLIDKAKNLLSRIDERAKGTDLHTDILLSKAFYIVNLDPVSAEYYLKPIIRDLSNRLNILKDESLEKDEFEDKSQALFTKLSYAFSILGTSLLNQKKAAEALKAYQNSLDLLPESSIAVNYGQIYHQIGKCESELGKYELGLHSYIKAANSFYYVGVKEYLSHSFTEIGYNLLEVNLPDLQTEFSEECIFAGLNDLMESTKDAFNISKPLDYPRCKLMFRKLTGTFYFLSLIGHGSKLEALVEEVSETILLPYSKKTNLSSINKNEIISFQILEALLNLGSYIVLVEKELVEYASISDETISALLTFICEIDYLVDDSLKITNWLAAYFSRRLKLENITYSSLKELIKSYNL